MKRLIAVLVAVLAAFAALLLHCSTLKSSDAEAILAAKARLTELSKMEVEEIRINSFGKEYRLNEPEDVRAVQDALVKMEPTVSSQNNLKKYEEPAAGARSMTLYFLRSDGTQERLTLDDFDAETPYGTMVFTAEVPGAPNAISTVFDAFYSDEQRQSYGWAHIERTTDEAVSVRASYNGESRSLEAGTGMEQILTALENAELEDGGWHGRGAEVLTLEFFYADGTWGRLTLPCFTAEGKFNLERYELYMNDRPIEEVIWELFES